MGDLYFQPGEFISNLKFMGAGMIGVFIVIGVIIAAVAVINKLGNKFDQKD